MAASFKDHAKKKTLLYKERNQEDRDKFEEYLKTIDPKTLVYIDEAGIDNRLHREYGRAKRGQKVHGEVCGSKRERVSIIGDLTGKTFIAPFTFQGGCNKDVFNAWIEQILLPNLPKKSTIVIDNASFHKSPKTST